MATHWQLVVSAILGTGGVLGWSGVVAQETFPGVPGAESIVKAYGLPGLAFVGIGFLLWWMTKMLDKKDVYIATLVQAHNASRDRSEDTIANLVATNSTAHREVALKLQDNSQATRELTNAINRMTPTICKHP